MAESWLCFVTERKILGINLINLSKSEADWSCLPIPNFDFSLDLPKPELCPFVFDSNIYMASGSLDPKWGYHDECEFPPNPIYEFKIDEDGNKKRKRQPQPGFSLVESFPPAPVPFLESFITSISGDVYVYVDPSRESDEPASIHVLCSASKEWKPLPLPPQNDSIGADGMFVLHGKLFLASADVPYLVSFDPISQSWTVEHDRDKNNVSQLSISSHFDMPGIRWISLPYFSVFLPGLSSNYSVALSSSYHGELVWPRLHWIKLSALLVNQNGGVILYQHLDECFEGIQPTIRTLCMLRFSLVDLGNGKLCAVLFGMAKENNNLPVLCISVFTPSVVKDFAALHTGSGAPAPSPMEKTFLSVTVHSKSVYTLKDWYPHNHMRHTFVWPPPKEGRFHHRTTPV